MNRMKILATCQYGWPEPHPFLYPMEEMVKRGHFVHAITGTPNYPMGDIFKGYEYNRIKEENHNGIHITHVPVVPRKQDSIHRFLNYHSYPIFAKKKIKELDDSYDVIFANQSSPVMMVEPAIEYARKWNKRVVMYCMDLWPASLCIGGVKKSSVLYKFYYEISKKIYKNVDVILVTSRMFKDYFISEFGIPEQKIGYLPQYALSEFENIPKQKDKDTIDFMFAGNVGVAQNLGVVLKAAKIIEDEKINGRGKRIVFHIIGDGQELDNLQNYVRRYKINNVIFHGRKLPGELPKYYALADAMIVTLTADLLISLTLPAKIQSYMAAGKPIIACAGGEISNVIKESGCGFCAKANDTRDFIEKIKEFLKSENRDEFGKKAKEYYKNNFSVETVIDKLESVLFENCR